ncbi:MAG: ECF-type sigma factor [Acidobacteriota bacterium]
MPDEARERVTGIIADLGGGERIRAHTASELFELVYDQLRRLARRYMGRGRAGHTLQPTALVHEAYLKLVDQTRVNWRGRTHFYAVGIQVMRRLLVDHARAHGRRRRGADWRKVTLCEEMAPIPEAGLGPEELLTLDRALQELGRLDEREARVVELRFFGGMKVPEVAEVLGVSTRAVEDDWTHAKAWLKRELAKAME